MAPKTPVFKGYEVGSMLVDTSEDFISWPVIVTEFDVCADVDNEATLENLLARPQNGYLDKNEDPADIQGSMTIAVYVNVQLQKMDQMARRIKRSKRIICMRGSRNTKIELYVSNNGDHTGRWLNKVFLKTVDGERMNQWRFDLTPTGRAACSIKPE